MASEAPFRLEIAVGEPARLEALRRVFDAIAELKRHQLSDDDEELELPEPDDPYWSSLLDEEVRLHFATALDADSEERRVHAALWALTKHEKRRHPIFGLPGPWRLEAVIDALQTAELLFESLEPEGDGAAVLIYEPLAGPFGGTESMVQLVEAFGHRVVYDAWHGGPPWRREVGWDFARAKALVAAGRGIE